MSPPYFRQWEPLLPPTGPVCGPLVLVSPHPDDEVIGAGGLILGHKLADEAVTVAVMTNGRLGDPGGDQSDEYVAKREAECLAAAQALGSNDTQFLGFEDGSLAPSYGADPKSGVEKLLAVLEVAEAKTLAIPSPFELHPDHKAAFLFGFDAWTARGRQEKLILYEVGSLMPCNFLLDITVLGDQKDRALSCYKSQLLHHDILAKVRALDVARCANIPDENVRRCEGYIEVNAKLADTFRTMVDALLIVTDRMKPGSLHD